MATQLLVIFIAINFLLVLAIIVFVINLLHSRREKALAGVKSLTSTKSFAGHDRGTGVSNGITYNYEFYSGSQNSPSFFKLSIDCQSDGSFEVTRESAFDKFFEKIGICSEVKTGDEDFDDNFYILLNSGLLAKLCHSFLSFS